MHQYTNVVMFLRLLTLKSGIGDGAVTEIAGFV